MRYFFEIAYKGTNYHGWQRQNNANSIQQTVEESLTLLLNEKIEITGSGRTDAGVHCQQQFFHIDFDGLMPEELLYKLNAILDQSIAVKAIHPMGPQCHARFDAVRRKYRYTVQRTKNPFNTDYSLLYTRNLDVNLMNRCAEILIGEKDFRCFSKVKTEVHTFMCNIERAVWVDSGDQLIFEISANRFLRGMVRSIVGTWLEVGEGKRTVTDIASLIESRDRKRAGASAAPQGLMLMAVEYPDNYFNLM